MGYVAQNLTAAAVAGLAAYGAVKLIEELAAHTRRAPPSARERLHAARLELARMKRSVRALESETAEEEGDDEAADIHVARVVRNARTGAAAGVRVAFDLDERREGEELPAGDAAAPREAVR